jgi:TolB-like protein/DNA-binding winged helix-turn-helix (wHTH) protein/Tfp pilus assembly protein PilF
MTAATSTHNDLGQARLVRFGVFEADLDSCELRKQGHKLRLQAQPCQVLKLLLEHPGEVITREEFRKRLWPEDTFVDFDHSLNTAMRRLREVLNDSPDNAIFIETLQRRGYRFIAPVTPVRPLEPAAEAVSPQVVAETSLVVAEAPNAAETLEKTGGRKAWRYAGVILASLFFGAALGLSAGWLMLRRSPVPEAKPKPLQVRSLAVLPLENIAATPGQEYLADGMTDELIASLAKVRSLRITSRTSSMEYKGTRKPLSEIARELNVDAVVEGTVQRSGGNVRITAELVQASSDRALWAETYENQVGDILALQQQVANAIVRQIQIELTPQEQQALTATQSISPEAYEDYLKGKYYWNRRSEAALTKAIGYFELATKDEPQYALAYAGLADCYGIIGAAIVGTVPAKDVAPKAEAAAIRAIELGPNLAESQTSMATVRLNYDWDWAGAERGFRRAIELNPAYATAHQRYSLYLIAMDRKDESIAEMQRAVSLEPLSVSMNFSLGWRLYMARRYDEAIQQLRTAIAMDPSLALAHMVLGQAYEQKSAIPQAEVELNQAVKLTHRSAPMIAALAHLYAVSGRQDRARGLLKELTYPTRREYVSPFYIALIYVGLNEHAESLQWIQKAIDDRSNPCIFLRVDPDFDNLRNDTRFKALLKRFG